MRKLYLSLFFVVALARAVMVLPVVREIILPKHKFIIKCAKIKVYWNQAW